MRLHDLIDRTGVAERQIRYLISEGFIPGPSSGRAKADYGEEHVGGIRRYMRLRELGFPPAAIKLLLDAREARLPDRPRDHPAGQPRHGGERCAGRTPDPQDRNAVNENPEGGRP